VPFHSKDDDTQDLDRENNLPSHPWSYWAKHQEENLRAALGEELFDWIETQTGEEPRDPE